MRFSFFLSHSILKRSPYTRVDVSTANNKETDSKEISQVLKLTLNESAVKSVFVTIYLHVYSTRKPHCCLFLQDLPDVQELIAEVNAEKYSLQAAAILGESTF